MVRIGRSRDQEPDSAMGLGAAWLVTYDMRLKTFELAEQGKPYPDPTIAHIMYNVAIAMRADHLRRLLLLSAGALSVTGAGAVLVAAGQERAAGLVIAAGLLVGGPFIVKTARAVAFWTRVRRANSSARQPPDRPDGDARA